MTMDQADIQAVVGAVEQVLATRLEGVRTEIDNLRAEVGEAVSQVRDTAQVLYDNDTAVMGQLAKNNGSAPAEFMAIAADAWARFIRGEAEALGWKVMVPK